MKKVLLVTENTVKEKYIAFFYEIVLCKNYNDAKNELMKNNEINLAIIEENEGIEEFLDYVMESEFANLKIQVFLKEESLKNMRNYFRKGAFDVKNEKFNPLNIFYYIDIMENDLKIPTYIKKIQKDIKVINEELSEYKILYEITKILRLDLDFEKIIVMIVELIESIVSGKAIFILNHNYYYSENSEWDKISVLKSVLKKYDSETIGEFVKKISSFEPVEIEKNLIYNFPVIIKNKLQGNLIFIIEKSMKINERQNELINNILSQSGVVIENAFLITESKKRNIDIVKSLVKAIEAKDNYTKGHSDRVAIYSVMIAEKMGLSDEKLIEIEMASVLHDVGKIGLPENILNKEGKLTDDEYKYIKQHPEKGYEIVSQIKNMQHIAMIIRYHHERWDGLGYPTGKKREEIPLESRIIAVADTYDAITSDRPYRTGNTKEFALKEIEKNKNKQFDPVIVEIFLSIEKL